MDEPERAALAILAANLRRYRVARKLTQVQLAEALAVEPRFLQSLEAATDAPGFRTMVRIATTLGVEVRDLFEPVEPLERNPGRPRKRKES